MKSTTLGIAMRFTLRIATIALLPALGVASCKSDATESPAANVHVYLSGVPEPEAEAVLPALHMGGMSIEAVDSVMMDLYALAGIQPTDTADYAAELEIPAGTKRHLDFRRLPPVGVDSIAIGAGRLPPGHYDSMRLRFSAATITLNTAVTSGGVTYQPGTYPLEVTNGITFAADVPDALFNIPNPRPVSVLITFDMPASIAGIRTGTNGMLVMNPIFRAVVTK